MELTEEERAFIRACLLETNIAGKWAPLMARILEKLENK